MIGYRKLGRSDMAEVARHIRSLNAADRRLRFHGGIGDAAIDRHYRAFDYGRAVLTGVFADGVLRGVSEIVFDRILWPTTAELAVTVEAAFRGRGFGQELTRRAALAARNRGAPMLRMVCLLENRPMQQIARELKGVLTFEEGAISADVALTRATPMTRWAELSADWRSALTM